MSRSTGLPSEVLRLRYRAYLYMHSMFMPVVRVWKVQVGVLHWLEPVPMSVLHAGATGSSCGLSRETPFLSRNDSAEWARQGCVVVGNDGLCFERWRIKAGISIGADHRIEGQIPGGTASTVYAVLSFHAGHDDAFTAAFA